jgi:hypothetical protein
MLSRASASVLPCEQHPGSPGTETTSCGSSLALKVYPHGLDDLAAGREDAHHPQRAAVDEGLAVELDLELSVAPVDRLHVDAEFATDPGRHTDGVQTRDSERAVADGDSSHGNLLIPREPEGIERQPTRAGDPGPQSHQIESSPYSSDVPRARPMSC